MTGKLIVGVGLPGSGKTTVLHSVAQELNAHSFREPEENAWDKAVMQRDQYGFIGALHWFRSQRVPNLIDARRLASSGHTVFLDTFYDKICFHYLGKPGMEWLLPVENPYFANFQDTAKLDYDILPDVDIVVYMDVKKDDWIKMLGSRGRQLDNLVKLSNTYHTAELFYEAAYKYCSEKGAKLVIHKNEFSSVQSSAKSLMANLLKELV